MKFDFKRDCRGIISVIGASDIDRNTEKKTIEIGRLLAKNGYAVSCGGLSGVMEAVCKGAKLEGGLTIGIIPSKEKSAANKYVDIAIPIPFSQARNLVVVLSGDACIAIAGKAGTLTEIALAWIYQKPIVALTDVGGWSSEMANKKVDDRRSDMVYGVKTAEEAVMKINELLKFNNSENLSFTDTF